MEVKLIFVLYITTLALSISCIAIDKIEEKQNATAKDAEEYNDEVIYTKKLLNNLHSSSFSITVRLQ